ncbi:MAG: DUF2889 domain-containing protein [Pseudomonadota bacterium]
MNKEEDTKSLKERITKRPIHSRSINLKTYPLEDNKIIIEGWLKDKRHLTVYGFDGNAREKGPVHFMVARLLVGGMPPTIFDAEAEMLTVPHDLCPSTIPSIKKIIGVKIRSGFSDKIRRMIGGKEGCAHLAHLVIAIGQEVVQGLWTHKGRKPRPIPRTLEDVENLPYLINSCSLWREGGPLMDHVQKTIGARSEGPRSKRHNDSGKHSG